ncbi:transcriptional regulator BolA [Jannaschia seosinensis]|uniref:Transcriptional regulator BolA n=1 Tax=Jannaschia seosinensis TaxID=313367 RepID=A0A0M7BFY7_9RHOB|nr:BolA family protein [Jannaschia seosinensis]CUH40246.1 transcriptional regulator BolA [Jannaschia seosinensis]
MAVQDEIEERLRQALDPSRLEVINESHRHAGHAGDDGSGESHWHVVIVSPAFADKPRIAQHRMVHSALGGLMDRIHALSMDLSAG